jgi:glycosyltransferase involved in cell wall biosynthesis
MGQSDTNRNPMDLRSKNIRNVCFYSFNFQDALSHLRLIGPAHHLDLNVIHGVENGKVFVDRAQMGDVIVLQRDFPRDIEAYHEIQTIAQRKQIPVVLDIDDLLFELPEDHPDRQKHTFTATLLPTFLAMLEADLITVTTQPLCDYVLNFNKNVLVLPNYLDDQIWQLKTPTQNSQPKAKIVIGYMGGHTHQPDLALILPVIKELTQRYPGRLEIQFWGTQPPEELSVLPNVHRHDQITWNYQDFATYFQTQSADIFIAPLANNEFNNSKSSIKYLEYGALGVPCVFSQVEPYGTVITQGENGFLASTSEEWLDCLTQLIESPDLRQSIATKARADIQSNWLLSDHASLWVSAYINARATMTSKTDVEPKVLEMIRNLSRQIVAMDRFTNDQLEQKRDKIIELEDLVAQKDATITGITNSRTWKLALLFRRMREFIAPSKN